jgi:peptidoglycan-associated lipoprotein
MRKMLLAVPVVVVMAAGSTACATKKFVRTEVGAVNDRVTDLTSKVEQADQRINEANERINTVDQKAGAADQKAAAAGQSADAAKQAADTAARQAEAVAASNKKLVYEVVLSEAQGGFRFGREVLPEEGKAQLDKMVADLQADPKAVWFEIEGHTDSSGPANVNDQLGLARAEAVKRYLYETHKVPLHKMNVISYGETKPVAPNRTRDGRAQNRRVEVKVLSPEGGSAMPTPTAARTGDQ